MTSKIANLFNGIAGRYDLLNHLFSLNIDKLWRNKALRGHISSKEKYVLDIACGTGDFAIQLIKSGAKNVIGVDISEEMMHVGRKKILKKGLDKKIDLQYGDCADLKFEADTFNAVTCAFGVRNFENRKQSLKEMYRVLKPGSELIILEFSIPRNRIIRAIYNFYFFKLMPIIGGLISGSREAYTYLPESVYKFPQGQLFLDELREVGFTKCKTKRVTFGIASIYYGLK